jgi:hypothetical protein
MVVLFCNQVHIGIVFRKMEDGSFRCVRHIKVTILPTKLPAQSRKRAGSEERRWERHSSFARCRMLTRSLNLLSIL